MLIIRKHAFARAGLFGNPSDGYHGKTISISLRNFSARVTLYEWDQVEIVASRDDQSRFRSIHELARDVRLHGYYGGIRLVKATIKKFADYCDARGIPLHDRNFSVRYESDIPRQVGLAGSSAIVVATLRCLMEFYGVQIPETVQPSFVLSIENEELGIAAGLQDRVIQVYEGCVFMDFSDEATHLENGFSCGRYERLDVSRLPALYVAYNTDVGEPTEVFHNNLRARHAAGEGAVLRAMDRLAELTVEARAAILDADTPRLARLIDENFDLRRSICRLNPDQERMVEIARAAGASAKFAGSGGAIIGTCPDETVFQRLCDALGPLRCAVIRPKIAL